MFINCITQLISRDVSFKDSIVESKQKQKPATTKPLVANDTHEEREREKERPKKEKPMQETNFLHLFRLMSHLNVCAFSFECAYPGIHTCNHQMQRGCEQARFIALFLMRLSNRKTCATNAAYHALVLAARTLIHIHCRVHINHA